MLEWTLWKVYWSQRQLLSWPWTCASIASHQSIYIATQNLRWLLQSSKGMLIHTHVFSHWILNQLLLFDCTQWWFAIQLDLLIGFENWIASTVAILFVNLKVSLSMHIWTCSYLKYLVLMIFRWSLLLCLTFLFLIINYNFS